MVLQTVASCYAPVALSFASGPSWVSRKFLHGAGSLQDEVVTSYWPALLFMCHPLWLGSVALNSDDKFALSQG